MTKIETGGEPATLGTAVHGALANMVEGLGYDLDDIARLHGVDRDELGKLVAAGEKAWVALKANYPEPLTEWSLNVVEEESSFGPEVILSGHIDVCSVADRVAYILDWKSGWLDTDYETQVKSYAFLVCRQTDAVRAVTQVVRLRDYTVDTKSYSREELEAWWIGFVDHVERGDYNPGPVQCGHCPRAHECPAKTQLLRQALQVSTQSTELSADPVERGAQLGSIHATAKMLAEYADTLAAVVKTEVVAAGGKVPIGGGYALEVSNHTERRLSFAAGWRILGEYIQATDYGEVFRVSKTAAEAVVKRDTPRGKKQAAWDEVMQRLTNAGAVQMTQVSTLRVKKLSLQVEGEQNGSSNSTGAGDASVSE